MRGPPGRLASGAWGLGLSILLAACSAEEPPQKLEKPGIREVSQPPPHQWTGFVQVDGQPEPVPAQWVATPEGRYAHGLRIPHPVPADSGYREGMKPEDYFLHLCRTEAGVRQYRFPKDVTGILFLRPPASPSDYDLLDRRKLEAPVFEAVYQTVQGDVRNRGAIFIRGNDLDNYSFYEEPVPFDTSGDIKGIGGFVQATGYIEGRTALADAKFSSSQKSNYAITWRGLRRPHDREMGISGVELIAHDPKTHQVVAVYREYGLTAKTRGTSQGVWWKTAALCPPNGDSKASEYFLDRLTDFSSSSLPPAHARSALGKSK